MFTVEQAAQIKQVFVKNFGRFVTEQELKAIHEEDYKGYLASKEECGYESYAEYFGDIFEDPYNESCIVDLIEYTLGIDSIAA
jgi:aminopeptidase-like protein